MTASGMACDDEISRDLRLIGQLANHELAAIELMALSLLCTENLTLPEARTIYSTMLDERVHFLRYDAYLKKRNLSFDVFPRSPFFWNLLSEHVASPPVFYAGVSLTLEQANLDFARHFKNYFKDRGDAEATSILEKVYEDEILHVRKGVSYLKKLQAQLSGPEQKSLWDLYCSLLPPLLSPRRARGIGFDEEARRRAGLDEDFIKNLAVFEASRGRPGYLYYFNPRAELPQRVRTGGPAAISPQTPKKNLIQLESDLCLNMSALLKEGDALFSPKAPSLAYLEHLRKSG